MAIYFAISFSNLSYAQQKFTGEGSIEIWNSDVLWAGQGNFVYNFTLDTQEIWSSLPPEASIENLVIKTNFGDITFSNAIDASDASRYPVGQLFSPEEIETIIFLQATGTINGVYYDLTDNVNPRDFTPVKIIKKKIVYKHNYSNDIRQKI
ncbi:MAG: hypothetical protein LBS60_14120 [Deltaproteobacteria bacterium]|nr:hypothetical protein [Deltaproteobacteria bacterium]